MKNRSRSPNITDMPRLPVPFARRTALRVAAVPAVRSAAWRTALRVAAVSAVRSAAWRTVLRAAAVVAACAAAAHGQPAAPVLEVLSPDGARYLSGRERLAVRLTPAGAPARVEFFVDGQRVCLRERPPFECDWDAGADGEARVIRVLATLGDGSRLVRRVHTPARAGFTFRSAVDVVLIPTIVTDRRGRYVTDLMGDRFEIREDGVRQRLGYFSPPADGGLELVVALDISGSMREAMPALRRGVSTLISELDTDDVVTLIAFNDRVFELAARETDRARLLSLVAGLETSGYTSLYDAIGRSLALLGGEPQRRAVLVFTDGDDRSSFSSLRSVERRVEESDAPLYVVTLGRRSEVREVREVATRLANVSGGQMFPVDRLDRLERALASFAGDLRNQYLLGYTPPPSADGGAGFRRLAVDVRGGDFRVRAREGYRPAAR